MAAILEQVKLARHSGRDIEFKLKCLHGAS